MQEFINNYLQEVSKIALTIDQKEIQSVANEILKIRNNNGRVFFIGVGGSAGNASHAVNDFRKLCNIDAYSPVDNISEISRKVQLQWFGLFFMIVKVET